MKKRIIVFFTALVVGILATGFTFLVFVRDGIDPDLVKEAMKYGVKTEGLTAEQMKSQLIEKFNEKQRIEYSDKARKLGINTNGLTDDQIKEKVKAIEDAAMIEKAKKAGIETDGLTPEQVIAKVNEKNGELRQKNAEKEKEEIQRMANEEKKLILGYAKSFNIDTTGLEYEKIREKVYEKLMPDLISKAKELNVDYSGLNYEQLLQKLIAKKNEIIIDNAKQ